MLRKFPENFKAQFTKLQVSYLYLLYILIRKGWGAALFATTTTSIFNGWQQIKVFGIENIYFTLKSLFPFWQREKSGLLH